MSKASLCKSLVIFALRRETNLGFSSEHLRTLFRQIWHRPDDAVYPRRTIRWTFVVTHKGGSFVNPKGLQVSEWFDVHGVCLFGRVKLQPFQVKHVPWSKLTLLYLSLMTGISSPLQTIPPWEIIKPVSPKWSEKQYDSASLHGYMIYFPTKLRIWEQHNPQKILGSIL